MRAGRLNAFRYDDDRGARGAYAVRLMFHWRSYCCRHNVECRYYRRRPPAPFVRQWRPCPSATDIAPSNAIRRFACTKIAMAVMSASAPCHTGARAASAVAAVADHAAVTHRMPNNRCSPRHFVTAVIVAASARQRKSGCVRALRAPLAAKRGARQGAFISLYLRYALRRKISMSICRRLIIVFEASLAAGYARRHMPPFRALPVTPLDIFRVIYADVI